MGRPIVHVTSNGCEIETPIIEGFRGKSAVPQ
jgi:hypothetical protein